MNHDYPLVICYKAMNNGPVRIMDVFPVQMLMFHSFLYVYQSNQHLLLILCPRLTSTPTTNSYDSQITRYIIPYEAVPRCPSPGPILPFDHCADVKAQIDAVLSEVLPHLEATEHVQRDPGRRPMGSPKSEREDDWNHQKRDKTSWCNSMLLWFFMDEYILFTHIDDYFFMVCFLCLESSWWRVNYLNTIK